MTENEQHADTAADLTMVEGRFLSVTQAMGLTSLSKSELYNRMADGSVKYAQYGKRRLIVRSSLLAFLGSKVVGA